MRYTIGLDVGTSSVGWAVINNDLNRIEDLGVRTFERAENPENGESLAKPRRDARSIRRRLDRRGYRLKRIIALFKKYNLLNQEEITQAHQKPNNPYEIRSRALDKLISNQELFISIYHISKRRGYKSNRKKADEGDNDSKIVLASAKQNQNTLAKYRSVGEMLFKDEQFNESKRNKAGDYKKCLLRESLINEIKTILIKQKEFGNQDITDNFYKDIINAASHQRPFASGDDIKNKVGKCTFEKDEMRAAKATPSFQLFNFLQKINNLKIISIETGQERVFSNDERNILINKAFAQKNLNLNSIRNELSIPTTEKFNIVYFIKRKEAEGKTDEEIRKKIEEKSKIPSLETIYILKNKFGKSWSQYKDNRKLLDDIAEILTIYKTDADITDHLKKINLEDDLIESLLDLSFSKFGHLSLRAINKLIPFLEAGSTYDKACEQAGYDFRVSGENNNIKLPPINLNGSEGYSITNPVVRRSITQTIKVINAIIDQFGSPESINIEMARDLSKDLQERRSILKHQKENQDKNESSEQSIKENYNIESVNGQDIVRMRLYKEQNGKCLYSGASIDEKRLFEDGYTEIDHIIPFSRSFDDGYANKALVLSSSNQDKLNRTPYEWIGSNKELWDEFETRVASMINIGYKKRQNLLTKKAVRDDLVARALNDTRYASKFLKNYIQRNLKFADSDKKNKVLTINGEATAYIRKRIGLNKKRQETDKHHAQDAAITAIIQPALINKINRFSKYREVSKYLYYGKKLDGISDAETNNKFDNDFIEEARNFASKHEQKFSFSDLLDEFPIELKARLSDCPKENITVLKNNLSGYKDCADLSFIRPIFVSRAPRRKTTGAAHLETIRSPKMFIKNIHHSALKVPLVNIHLKDLERLAGKEKTLREALKQRLEKYKDDPKKAFSKDNPFYKPLINGGNGPLVRSVRLVSSGQKSGLLINNNKALVDQSSMVRIDIFSKTNNKNKEQFFIIPVYAYHFAQGKLPNKVIIGGKPESEWADIDNSYNFLFSLYPNDLVKIVKNNKEIFGYYINCDRSTAAISIKSHDASKYFTGNGIKTIDKIEKYVVDMLGRCHLVKREKRQEITHKKY